MFEHIIGHESEEVEIEIDQGQLCVLALANGKIDTDYRIADSARAAGLTPNPAQKLLHFVLDSLNCSKRLNLESLGIAGEQVLMGGIAIERLLPIQAGDRVKLKTRVKDAYEKKGGSLRFLVLESELFSQDGRLCMRIELRPIVCRRLLAAA